MAIIFERFRHGANYREAIVGQHLAQMFATMGIVLWGWQSASKVHGYFEVIASQGFWDSSYAPVFHMYSIAAFVAIALLVMVYAFVRQVFATRLAGHKVLRTNSSVVAIVTLGGYGIWVLCLAYVHMLERIWYGR